MQMRRRIQKLVAWAAVFLAVPTLIAGDFIVGADMSHLAFFENRGVSYRDAGQVQDALEILKRRGVNCIRLRLFTSSATQAQANPYNAINNLDYTLPLAVRVKSAGLKFLLDFHYSDTWADPGKQAKPATWAGLSFTQLEAQIRDSSSNSIAAFKAAGAMPDYVQIGNEIIGGMLWNDGRVGGAYDTAAQWTNLGRLLKAARQGVMDGAGEETPQVMIHIDRGGDWVTTQWFFDKLNQQSVPFDIIGQSFYPWWHGNLNALQTCLTNTVRRYGKPVVIAETGFPWADSTNIYGIPASTNGQVEFVTALAQVIKSVPGGQGIGVFWWGTEYQRLNGYNLAGFDRRSFFGDGGNVLPVADVFGRLAAPLVMRATPMGSAVNLDWPLSGAGASLMETTGLAASAIWWPVTNVVQSTGAVFSTTLGASNSAARFYRLQTN